MLDENKLAELACKKKFVKCIGDTLKEFNVCDKELNYDVFTVDGTLYEYLVVTYKSGAITTTTCNGDSLSIIFDEIVGLLSGGYYAEVPTYRQLKANAVQVLD